MTIQLRWDVLTKVALSCLPLALAPACSSSSTTGGAQTTGSSQGPGDGGGDDATGSGAVGADAAGGDDTDASAVDAADAADAADGAVLTVACGQSVGEWCCTYPGAICWPTWTSATSCLTPQLSVTAMPGPCGGFEAVRYDSGGGGDGGNGGFIYTLYDATSGAFVAQGAENQGSFGCFGGPTPFSILASCIATWDTVPSAPCVVDADAGGSDAGDLDAGDADADVDAAPPPPPPPPVGPSTYCDGGSWTG